MLLLVATTTMPASVHSTSLTDMVPGLAQLKSIFQLITEDTEGAKQTQLNFINDGLITSQARSLYFLMDRDVAKALEIQKDFGGNLEPIIDGIPVVGHIKSIFQLAHGDVEKGLKTMETATSSTGAVAGGLLGGPAGAIIGKVLTDGFITAAERVLRPEDSEPHGVFNSLSIAHNSTSSELFDSMVDLTMAGGVGKIKSRPTPINRGYQRLPNGYRNPYQLETLM